MKYAPRGKKQTHVGVEEVAGIVRAKTLDPTTEFSLNHSAKLLNYRCNHLFCNQQVCPGVPGGLIHEDQEPTMSFQTSLWSRSPYITVDLEERSLCVRIRGGERGTTMLC